MVHAHSPKRSPKMSCGAWPPGVPAPCTVIILLFVTGGKMTAALNVLELLAKFGQAHIPHTMSYPL